MDSILFRIFTRPFPAEGGLPGSNPFPLSLILISSIPFDRSSAILTLSAPECLTTLCNASLITRNTFLRCQLMGCWYTWTGQRWEEDKAGEIMRRAKATVRTIYEEAAAIADDNARRDMAAHARRSEGEQRLHAMVGLAQSELGIPIRYVGTGEKIDDIQEFNATEFVDDLFES